LSGREKGGIIIPTFFIVDDNRVIHEAYSELLELKGHKVIGNALNGIECLEKINNSEKKPDFILMDYRMPEKEGIEVMKELLEIQPELKVIFVSADESVEKNALSAGAIMFIKKPFNLQTFYKHIEQLTR
jgi:two-component system chemotaxis response regulator CheY